jgi:hypothetical protein
MAGGLILMNIIKEIDEAMQSWPVKIEMSSKTN